MIASGYTVDLYCDAKGHIGRLDGSSLDAQFSDESSQVVWRAIRKAGWVVSRKTGIALCPSCIRAGRTELAKKRR